MLTMENIHSMPSIIEIIEVKATDGPGWIEWWWPTDGDDDVEKVFNQTINRHRPNNRGLIFRRIKKTIRK